MKFRLLIALVASALFSTAAQAQLGIYGAFDASQFHQNNVHIAPAGTTTTEPWLYGGTVGFYDDFIHLGPVRLGADVRGDFVRGDGYSRDSGLLGVRAAFKLPVLPIKPYVQGSAGLAHIGRPSGSSSNNLEYRIAGGIDFTILPHIDWRAVEIGGGSLIDYSYGSGANQSNSLLSYSTGIVIRLF